MKQFLVVINLISSGNYTEFVDEARYYDSKDEY